MVAKTRVRDSTGCSCILAARTPPPIQSGVLPMGSLMQRAAGLARGGADNGTQLARGNRIRASLRIPGCSYAPLVPLGSAGTASGFLSLCLDWPEAIAATDVRAPCGPCPSSAW